MKTANPYLIPAGSGYTRGEMVVDVDRFATDLATALRDERIEAQVVIFDTDVAPKWRSSIDLSGAHGNGGDLGLIISTGTPSARHDGKVDFSVTVRDIPQNERGNFRSTPENKLPTASLSTDRPLSILAKDVIRRVIEPAIAPAENLRQALVVMNDHRAELDRHIANLESRYPGLFRFKKTDDGLNAQIDPVSYTPSGPRRDYFYFMGRLSHDGSVTVDRINTMSPAFFADLCAVAKRHYPLDGAQKQATGVDDLVDSLRDYVSGDDGNLTKNDFLRMVADRINEDLADQLEP